MKWLIFIILNEDKWIWKRRIRRKKEGQGGFGEVGSLSLDLWQNLYGRNRGGVLCEKGIDHVGPSCARACSLILCFLGYLMKYWWETWEVRGPGWLGVGGVGLGSVTAASCGSGHLCQSRSASDGPQPNLIWLRMSPYHRRWKNKTVNLLQRGGERVMKRAGGMCSQNISNMS